MAAYPFCPADALRALIAFNTSYEKFDLSTYFFVDNTLFFLILMPQNINLRTAFQHIKFTFRKGSR